MIPAMAYGAGTVGPSEFYVVSQSFSDFGPSHYYRVLEVRPDSSDSVVRYIRVAPRSVYCPVVIVQATEARVRKVSPAELVGDNNPCLVSPGALRAGLKRYPRKQSIFEATSFGIVAQCGSTSLSLGLPFAEHVDLARLKEARPEIARLWDLASEIVDRVFGEKDVFHDRGEDEDVVLQSAGEKVVPELVSGRFDTGLAAAVGGGTEWSPSFRSLLSKYRGPVSEAEAKAGYAPQILNAQDYRFSRFVEPKYPPLALQARIQGNVELRLNVSPATGEVNHVMAVFGHPLLRPSTMEAARAWRFAPNSVASDTLTITVEFAFRSPCVH